MPFKYLLVLLALVSLSTGCGRSDYDAKVESAIRQAKNPPADTAKEEGAGDAADAAAQDPAAGEPAKADDAGMN